MFAVLFIWLPLFLLFYSYALYPALIQFFARRKKQNTIVYLTHELPNISILISAYNEEQHIEQRIRNIFISNYPQEKIELLVGSDGSTDNTNSVLEKLKAEFPQLKPIISQQRRGKSAMLNQLAGISGNSILVLTDAKVLFSPHTLYQLVKHFKNRQIGIVGGNIVNKVYRNDGVSKPENTYMSGEMKLKYNEGILWGTVIGVYGACYAMRKELFDPFPDGLTVEDFYNTLKTIGKQKKVIIEKNALSYENVTNRLHIEFKRKVRISAGNFQNLNYFRYQFFKLSWLGFCLVSHKLIRWVGPVFLLLMLTGNIFLAGKSNFYFYSLVFQIFLYLTPIIDFFLHKIRVDIIILRFVSHFYLMNLALAIGLVKYLKRKQTNVWEPTKR